MSKEQAAAPSELGMLIGAAHAEYEAEIPEIVIDPKEVPLAMARKVAKLRFPNEAREREAAAILRRAKPQFIDLIRRRQYEALDRAVADVESQIMRLTIPERTLSVREQANKARASFRAKSWTTEEVDALGRYFDRSGALISEIGVSFVKVGDELITREQIRTKLKACGVITTAMERQENEAIQLEAANRVRKERGESPFHRQW
jgi:hypothetical protein